MRSLNTSSEEHKYEDPAKSSSGKLLDTENLMELSQNELKLSTR